MGGTSSKTNNFKRSKFDYIEDKINNIVNDIFESNGNGNYRFKNNKYENYRNLTDQSKCKEYVAFVENALNEHDKFPIYDKDRKLGKVTMIKLKGDHDKRVNGTEVDGSIVFKGTHFTQKKTCSAIANYYIQLLNLIETLVILLGVDKKGETFCETRMKSLYTPNLVENTKGTTKICVKDQLKQKNNLASIPKMDYIKNLYNPDKALVIDSEENKTKLVRQRGEFLNKMYRLFPRNYMVQTGGNNKKTKNNKNKLKSKKKYRGGSNQNLDFIVPLIGDSNNIPKVSDISYDYETSLSKDDYHRFLGEINRLQIENYNPANLTTCQDSKYQNLEIDINDPSYKTFFEKYKEYRNSYLKDLNQLYEILQKIIKYNEKNKKYEIKEIAHEELQNLVFDTQNTILNMIESCEKKYRESLSPLFNSLCKKNFVAESQNLLGPLKLNNK